MLPCETKIWMPCLYFFLFYIIFVAFRPAKGTRATLWHMTLLYLCINNVKGWRAEEKKLLHLSTIIINLEINKIKMNVTHFMLSARGDAATKLPTLLLWQLGTDCIRQWPVPGTPLPDWYSRTTEERMTTPASVPASLNLLYGVVACLSVLSKRIVSFL